MTDFLRLISKEIRIIIFVPDFKKNYFVKEFSGLNIVIEGIDDKLASKDLFFRRLILAFTRTRTLYVKKRSKFHRDKNLAAFLSTVIPGILFGRFKSVIELIRFIDQLVLSSKTFASFFERYNPALIFATDIQNELDVRLIQEAKRRDVKTVGMVRSWDNLTSKGIIRAVPDKLLVHNEIIKREAMKYNFIQEENIAIIGIPHYDYYLKAKVEAREVFFKKNKFDPKKPLILFSPIGDRYIHKNVLDKEVLETLSLLDANILVRLPPCDVVNFEGLKDGKARIVFDRTGLGFEGYGVKANEISRADEERLINSLYHCDLVVTGHSTMVVDASVFNKPIIIIYFNSKSGVYWESVRRYYDCEYYRPILESGGIELAHNPEELLTLVDRYFKNPKLHSEGRKKIISEQVKFLDGRSARRLFQALMSLV